MATIGGNNSVNDGLVFHYDTGNKLKSFKGEPTVNLYSEQEKINVVGGSFTTNTYENGIKTLENTIVDNSHVMWNSAAGFTVNCLIGDKITISAEYKTNCKILAKVRESNTNGSVSQSTRDIEDTKGEWVRYSITVDVLVNNPLLWWYIADYRPYSQFGKVEVRNWQCEVKPHPTPFTPTTRTATESLIDLRGNTLIDVTSTSFDSDGMYFDGIDDFVNSGLDLSWNNTNSVTIECVIHVSDLLEVRPFLGTNPYEWQFRQNSDKLEFTYWNETGGHTNGPLPIISNFFTVNTPVHMIMTWNSITSNMNFYKNGIEVGSYLFGNPTINKVTNGTMQIGGNIYKFTNTTRFWDGQIPITKIYNKALTPEEVKRNFNAVRSRFNI